MVRMVHPDSPEPYDTVTDDQADVLRQSGWKAEAQVQAAKTRKRAARKAAKKSAPPAAEATTTEAGGAAPADTEKE